MSHTLQRHSIYFVGLFFFVFLQSNYGQVNFTDSNLPIIVINTNDQEILDDPKINCRMGIIWNTEGERNNITDPYNDYDGHIGIEIRGSTSQQYPKKSYSFETRDSLGNNLNTSILGLPKEHDWILYGAYPDKTLLRNELTYSVFGQMHDWSPRYVYCELVINGEYLGLYTLIEKIKRDNDRIDIATLDNDDNAGDSITGGYIIKIDKPTGSSSISWSSTHQDKLEFLYHDPKYLELTPEQRDYITTYVDDFESALYGPDFKDPIDGYEPYINVESFIDFMIMQELGRTVDGYRSSSFMYKDKDSKDGKLTCGPMWDFNLSYGNADYCDAYLITGYQYNFAEVCSWFSVEPPNWWTRLLEDPAYRNALDCRWTTLREDLLSTSSIHQWIDSTAQYLDEAQQRNFIKWPILGEYVNWNYFVGETYQEEIDYLKEWYADRAIYLDNNFPGTCGAATSIEDDNHTSQIQLSPNPTSGFCTLSSDAPYHEIELYSLEGKPVSFHHDREQLDISHLPNGFYILRVDDVSVRLVKQ